MEVKMENSKQKLRKNILVIGILSAILLSGCSKGNTPQEEAGSSSPSEKVMEQVISEWKEMYASYYDYQDCSAVLSERTENDGTVDEIFIIDITYTSQQSDSDEPEHFIADMKASYPADNPEEITLWMDNSGGTMIDLILFSECGPG